MKRFLWAFLFLFLLPPLSAWGRDFSVVSFSPTGEISGKPEIKIVFSGPAAEQEILGKILPQDSVPLEIRPSVKGCGIWDSQDTLIFVADRALSQATEYQVTMKPLRDISGNLLAGPQSFRFNTPPLKLLSVRQVSINGSVLTLEIRFSMPVPPQRLLGFVTAASSEADFRIIPQGEAPSDRITVKVQGVVPGDPVTLTIEKGLTSDLGPLGLPKTEKVTLEPSVRLQITGNYGESQSDSLGRLSIYTSCPIDPGDVKGYVSLSPEKDFRIEPLYGGFALVGEFLPRDRCTVTLKKGLGGKNGLEADRKLSFVIPDRDRSLSFPVTGTFLSPMEDPRIPLDTVNLDRVELSAWKLYSNNVPVVTGALGSGAEPPKSLSRFLGARFYEVDNRLNKTVRSALDLGEFLGESRGVFLIEAVDSDGSWDTARQVVTLTDMGISSRIWEKGLLVWVVGLSSAEPVPNAAVSVYSSSNQLIAEGITDERGLFVFSKDDSWDEQLRPAVVTAERDGDLSFLTLWGDGFSDSGIDVSGAPWIRTYEADCLLPRGIFRPGETVDVTSVVRGPGMALPGRFPVLWKVTGAAMDLEVARGSETLSPMGTARMSFRLPPEAPTGVYSFELSVPGGGEPLGEAAFLVQDFTPPKVELKIESDSSLTSAGSDVSLSFSAAYLFGAPSPGLNWEIQAVTSPRSFVSGRFPDYVFGDGEVGFDRTREYVDSGCLDEEGRGEFSWTVPTYWRAPSMVDLSFILNAMEPGGRWVSETLTLPCALSIHQLGIRAPEGPVVPEKPASFRIASVTAEDKPVSIPLRWELFKLCDRYVMVRENGRTRMKWQEEKISLGDGTFSTDSGRADLPVTPDSEGSFLLAISDGRGSSASVRFCACRSRGSSVRAAAIPDRVDLALDRDRYLAGDEASLTYAAPFPGTALLTVESDGLIQARVLTSLKKSGKLTFPVDKKIWPNGWCTLQVVRPLASGGAWGSFRALGALPFSVAADHTRARVELDAPASMEPGQPVRVAVSVLDGEGKPLEGELWAALVDKGILDLTGFEAPDPWKLFTAKRRLGSEASDLYDELMPIESRETPLLHPSGGDGDGEALALNLSPLKARGFRVLSMVDSPLQVRDGAAVLSFDLPEFSGGAKLMTVFAGDLIGSAQTSMSVARDIVVDPAVPQVLAPEDRVFVPVRIISTSESDRDLTMEIESNGAWSYLGQNPLNVSVPAGKALSLELSMKAARESGYGGLTLHVSLSSGEAFSLEREVVVRPPMPRITVSHSTALEKGSFSPEQTGRWLPGTVRSSLYLSGSRRADLLPLVSFLRGYPYRCLEQSVSVSWPLVAVPEMVGEMESLLPSEVRDILKDQIAHIQTLQLYDGSFTCWPNWAEDPWGSLCAAHLLALADPSLVPEAMADRTKNYLRAVLSNPDDGPQALSEKAYSAYIMALDGQAPMGWMDWLSERAGRMNPEGRAFLAGAYGLAGQKKQGLAMMGGVKKGGPGPYGSPLAGMAVRLLAMESLAPGSPEEAMLAGGLIEAVNMGRLSTNEAGLAVLALGNYAAGADVKPFKAQVTYGGETYSLAPGDDLALSSDSLVPWTLENSGPGPVYASWTVSGVPEKGAEPVDSGVAVRRTISDRDGNPLDLSKPLRLGQEIKVIIEITPTGTVTDLVVVDVLPGCFEVWDPCLEEGCESAASRKEVRFDRVIVFPGHMDSSVTVGYRCRVVARGDFALPPVAAEAMYDPATRSLSGEGRIAVR